MIVSVLVYGQAVKLTNIDTKEWAAMFPGMIPTSENLRGAKIAVLADVRILAIYPPYALPAIRSHITQHLSRTPTLTSSPPLSSQKLKKKLQKMRDAVADVPHTITYPFLWSYVQLCNAYINAPEGKRIAYQICAINGAVWLMWQFGRLQPFMRTFFTHNPLSGRYITLLYSVFRSVRPVESSRPSSGCGTEAN